VINDILRKLNITEEELLEVLRYERKPYRWVGERAIFDPQVQFTRPPLGIDSGGGSLEITVTNSSGGALAEGDVVIFDKADSGSGLLKVTTTTVEGDKRICGVMGEAVSDGASGKMLVMGIVPVLCTGTVAVGNALITSTTAKVARAYGGAYQDGLIGYAVEAATLGAGTGLVDCYLRVNWIRAGGGATLANYSYGSSACAGGGGTVTSVSSFPSTGTNRVLLGFMGGYCSAGGSYFNWMDFNADTLTTEQTHGAGGPMGACCWIVAPDVATADVRTNWSSSGAYMYALTLALELTEVAQSSSFTWATKSSGTSTTPSITVSTTPGDFVVAWVRLITTSTISVTNRGSGQSEVMNTIYASAYHQGIVDKLDPATGSSHTLTWTLGTSVQWACHAVAIHPI
jgi:hypothetical protein